MAEEIIENDKKNGLEGEMEKYEIKCVPIDYFHINGFRYTDLKDAVAQAKRMKTVKASN